MRLRLKANPVPIIKYDFIGGPEDQWIFDVEDCSFEGGYYTPPRLSGHPDSWAPEEGEDPTISCTLWLWVWNEGDPEPDPSSPQYVIEVVNDILEDPESLPEGVEAYVFATILPNLIETRWRP